MWPFKISKQTENNPVVTNNGDKIDHWKNRTVNFIDKDGCQKSLSYVC